MAKRHNWMLSLWMGSAILVLLIGAAGCRSSLPVNGKVGCLPSGWQVAETAGAGKPATWQITEDCGVRGKVIALTKSESPRPTFNLLIAEKTNFRNPIIKVKVKAVSGVIDEGGGPIWRVEDANNYYISRWNPLENNVRVYYVKDGKRKQLGSADVKVDAAKWQEIGIVHKGNDITVLFNGEKVINVQDSTFTKSGKIGLWTKADAVASFAELKVEESK